MQFNPLQISRYSLNKILAGIQGGNYIVNYTVYKLITKSLGQLLYRKLAALLNSFKI
jgi:hypothetical protein